MVSRVVVGREVGDDVLDETRDGLLERDFRTTAHQRALLCDRSRGQGWIALQ